MPRKTDIGEYFDLLRQAAPQGLLSDNLCRIVDGIIEGVRNGETSAVLRSLQTMRETILALRPILDRRNSDRLRLFGHFTQCRDHAELQLALAMELSDQGNREMEQQISQFRQRVIEAQQKLEEFSMASIADIDPEHQQQ